MEPLPRRVLLVAPVNIVPPPQTTVEDTAIVFSVAGGNGISISDSDADGEHVTVALTVSSGKLTLAQTTGLSFSTGDGSGDAAIVLAGTLANINAALDGMTFIPAADFIGTATFTIDTEDEGTSGPGGEQPDSDSFDITVTAGANDPPVNNVPDDLSTAEGLLVLSSGNLNAITITDPDAGAGLLEVSLTTDRGTLTLGSTTSLTFITGNGAGDDAMTFRGTLAAINNALDGLEYRPPLLFAGPATITITSNDLGNTGAGGAMSDTDIINLTADAVNDPPVNTVPPAQTINEDGALIFSAGDGNAITISDSDVGGAELSVALSVASGLLTLATSDGLTFITGGGIDDASMLFTGTLSAVNAALNGLTYAAIANYSGSDTLEITSNDLGNTGPGGARSDSDSVAITINADDDPAALAVPPQQAATEGVPLIFSSSSGNAITLADPDAGSTSFSVTLSSPGKLTLAGTTGLTFADGDGSDDAAMTFTGTLSDINAALNGLTFLAADNPLPSATLSISATDGAQTIAGSVALSVTPVNDAPINTVPAAVQVVSEDASLVFSTAAGNRVAVLDYDVGTGVLRVTLTATGGTVSLASLAGLTIVAGDGAADSIVTFEGAPSWVNVALEGLSFHPTPDYAGPASIRVQTSDLGSTGLGGAQAADDTVGIDVTAVNDAPVLSVPPGTQQVNEGQPLMFGVAGGNPISVVDIDAAGGALRVKLTLEDGTITLATLAGLTFINGDGVDGDLLIFTGSLADINAALDGLAFTAAADQDGAASMLISVKDQGHTGHGGNLEATATVPIGITAINEAPILVLSPALLQFVEGDGPVPIDDVLTLTDPDAGGTIHHATVRIVGHLPGSDVLSVSDKHGITGQFDAITGILTLSGTDSTHHYQSALRSVTYQHVGSGAPPRTIVVEVSDGVAIASASRGLLVQAKAPPLPPTPPTPPLPPTSADPQNPVDVDPIDPEPLPPEPTEPQEPADITPPADNTPPTPGGGDSSGGGTGENQTPGGGEGTTIVEEAVTPPPAPSVEPPAPVEEPKNPVEQLPSRTAPVIESPVATPVQPVAPAAPAAPAVGLSDPEVAFVTADGELWHDLDTLREEVQTPEKSLRLLAGVASAGTIGLSVVYILWMIRAGYLLASLLSSLPAWRFIDPLPILDQFDSAARRGRGRGGDQDDANEDQESLETMVDPTEPKEATR